MHTALACLLESLLKDVVRKTVNLDIHLGSGDTVSGTGYLEVHITEVILIAEDIGKDGITVVRTLSVGYESHSHTCNRLLDLDARIHKSEAAATY